MSGSSFRIRAPDDFHVHLRQADDGMLAKVAPSTARVFARALVMPNTNPAITQPTDIVRYKEEILEATRKYHFTPLMTAKLTDRTTTEDVAAYRAAGAIACKLYPEGATSHSNDAVSDIRALQNVYAAMQEQGLVLCVHGEIPGAFRLERETLFLETLLWLTRQFPRLRIVLEHASSKRALEAVFNAGKHVAATITVHHLYLTLDDVVGGLLQPHNFCKPIAKTPDDRRALIQAAVSGLAKTGRIFLGTDSAPWVREQKECSSGCAGIFTAPVALPLLTALFDDLGKLDALEAFTSIYGAEFYQLPPNEGDVGLARRRWSVPDQYQGIIPFKAREVLEWDVEA